MNSHKNARLTAKGRAHLIEQIALLGLHEAARRAGISTRRARIWHQRAMVPDEIAKPEGESEYFNRDDSEQCQRVLGYLLELADRASLMRVVWGCAVMLDPANKCVDSSSDTLEHHPDIQRYEWLRNNFAALEFSREGNRLRIENGDAPEKLDILLDEVRAATDAARLRDGASQPG